jgi:hypothetical protein
MGLIYKCILIYVTCFSWYRRHKFNMQMSGERQPIQLLLIGEHMSMDVG